MQIRKAIERDAGTWNAPRGGAVRAAAKIVGCFYDVLFISSVDVMQNCEGGLSSDKFLF